jgi:rRNA maturation protein Nop10
MHECPRCGYDGHNEPSEDAEPSETYQQYRREAEHAKRRLGLTEPQPDLTRYMAMLFKALGKK